MAGASQQELEQPAKVYQLNAVETKVDTALLKLDALLTQTSSLISVAQLDAAKAEIRFEIAEEIKKIHLTYGPMKKNLGWFVKLVIGAVVGIIIQGAVLIWSLTGGQRG